MSGIGEIVLSPWVSPKILGHYGPDYRHQLQGKDRWYWVDVAKRDENGKFVEDEETLKRSVKCYLYDRVTGNYHVPDPLAAVAFKTFMLFWLTPFYAAGTMALNTLKVPFEPLRVLLSRIVPEEVSGKPKSLEKRVSMSRELFTHLKQDVWNALRSPFYALGIEFAIFRGLGSSILDPAASFETRAVVANIEKQWNHNISRKADPRYFKMHNDPSKVKTFYLAFCFQPIGNFDERCGSSLKRKKLEVLEILDEPRIRNHSFADFDL